GAGVAVSNSVVDADVATLISTGSNFRVNSAIGFDTTAGDRTYTPAIANTAQGALGAVKVGANTLILSNSNTYTGTTVIAGGVLQAGGTSALGTGNISFSGGTFQYTAATAGTDWASRIKSSGSAIALDTNGQNVTLAGIIDSTNTGGLTKTGNGTLVLSPSTAYTGLTTVSQGILQSGSTTAATTAVPAGNYAVAANAKLVFARNIDNVAFGTQSISGAGDVEFTGQTGGYFTFRQSGSPIYTGTLSYTGQTIVNMTATATGVNAYKGSLWLEKDNVLPNSTVVNMQSGKIYTRNQTGTGISVTGITGSAGTFITADGSGGTQKWTVTAASGTSYTYAGTIGWDGQLVVTQANGNNISFTKAGAGTQILSGSNTYTGATTVTGGTLQIGSGGTTGSISNSSLVTLSNGAVLAFNRSDNLTYGGTVSGAGGLVKLGSNAVTITGIQAYTGATSINGGRLEITSSGRINGTSGITINGSGAELKYNSATPLTQPITFTQGMISGTGIIGTLVTVGTNDIIAPGNSPGIQPYAAGLTWAPGGTYEWEFNAMSGTPGISWDLVDVTSGTFSLTGLSTTNTFLLDLITLTGGNVAGPLDSPYVPGSTYSFLIADFGGSTFTVPVGYSTAAGSDLTGLFSFNLTRWQGTAPSVNDISVKVNSLGTGIELIVVPEPSALAIAGIGIVAAAWAVSRRRRAAA
ncbi:MAG: autotransporter-associated beta strand repeat-containing protein, partial [Planctomycetia bacterium]|nr:autotransporter-associated beta strand repeat-containing protein [Planctomycetia bacterium]